MLISNSLNFGVTNNCFWWQRWCSGKNTVYPPMWPGFDSSSWRHMWVEFVFASLLCSKRFFCGYSCPVSPSPQWPTLPNSNLICNLRTSGLSVPTTVNCYPLKIESVFLMVMSTLFLKLKFITCAEFSKQDDRNFSFCLDLCKLEWIKRVWKLLQSRSNWKHLTVMN